MRCTVTDQGPHAGTVRRFPAGPRCHAHRPDAPVQEPAREPVQVEPAAPAKMDAPDEARDQPNPSGADRKRSTADVDTQAAILAELERHERAVADLHQRHRAELDAIKGQHHTNLHAIKDDAGLTYAELGEMWGVTRQAAHQRLNP